MAHISKLMETKDGRRYWRIYVSRKEGGTYTTRFYWPDGYTSQKAVENLRNAFASDFEKDCKAGNVLNRKEKKEKEERERQEAEAAAAAAAEAAAKIETFRQYGERVFLPAKTITTSENTRRYYENALVNHLYPVFGDIKLPEITSAQINAFFLTLQDSGLAHGTIIGIYVTINQLLTMAYLDDSIERNPMDKAPRPRQRKDEKKQEVQAFTVDELKRITKCLESEELKWQVYTRLMIDTGIRRGEACALRWDAIDFNTNTATISQNLCYTSKKGVYFDTPKTGKSRDVYFSPKTAKLLKELQAEQKEDAKRRAKRLEKEGKPLDLERVSIPEYVFTEKGFCTPMHPQSPNRFFQKFGKKCGLDIHPHMLRHSFASVAITNGADIASVSEVLGHADKATTLRMYTHADEESKRRASAIVRAAIGEL